MLRMAKSPFHLPIAYTALPGHGPSFAEEMCPRGFRSESPMVTANIRTIRV